MPETSLQLETALEIIAPDKSRQRVSVTQSPFYIGRGGESDNHLQLADGRISRKCAAIVIDGSSYLLEDRGNRYGLYVNGAKVERQKLRCCGQDASQVAHAVKDTALPFDWRIRWRDAQPQ